ncbi:hypothetical protein B0H19DRAFT_1231036 [Mycena capillaripes]|nr:hypothetical protein B0H19DRAFT_1231036 [Mycena capillaripes]
MAPYRLVSCAGVPVELLSLVNPTNPIGKPLRSDEGSVQSNCEKLPVLHGYAKKFPMRASLGGSWGRQRASVGRQRAAAGAAQGVSGASLGASHLCAGGGNEMEGGGSGGRRFMCDRALPLINANAIMRCTNTPSDSLLRMWQTTRARDLGAVEGPIEHTRAKGGKYVPQPHRQEFAGARG